LVAAITERRFTVDELPTGLELTLLQNAQELGLSCGRHAADLVEEDGAAVGLLESSQPVAYRARECALHVAEQLAWERSRAPRN
jgi:hypothetical protein